MRCAVPVPVPASLPIPNCVPAFRFLFSSLPCELLDLDWLID